MPGFDQKLDQLQAKLPTLDPEKRARAEALLARHGRKVQAAGPAPTAAPKPAPPATPRPQAPAPEGPGVIESFARGGGQGLTSGFGEEVSSAIASGLHKMFTGEGDIPRAAARGSQAPLSDRTDYDVIRDAERADNAAAQEAHGGAYLGGEIVGAGLQAVAGGELAQGMRVNALRNSMQAAPKVSTAGKLLRGAGNLAGQGAVTGAGVSEAQDAAGVAKDAATGAAATLAAGGVLHSGAKLVSGAADKSRRLAEIATARRLRAAGIDPSSPPMMAGGPTEPAPAPGRLDRIGRALGIGEEPAATRSTGATRQVANMKAQGIGTGVEGTPKIAQQAGRAVENIEATRKGILRDNPGAGQTGPGGESLSLGQSVGTRLRRRRNALGGFKPSKAQEHALKDEYLAQRAAAEGAEARAAGVEAKAKHQVDINDYKANRAAQDAAVAEPLAQGATAAGRVRARGLRKRAHADTLPADEQATIPVRGRMDDTVPDKDLEKMADAAEIRGERAADRLRNPRPEPPPEVAEGQGAAAEARRLRLRHEASKNRLPPEQAGDRAALNEQIRHFEDPANLFPSISDLNARRKSFSFKSEGRPANEDLAAGVRDDLNSVIQDALNRSSQGAGDNWRKLAAQEAAAITAREGATKAANTASSGRGFGDMIAALAGDAVGTHSLRAKAAEVGSAVYGSPVMRRILSPAAAPAAEALGRTAAAESIRKVQSYGDAESRAREHFLQSLQNPEYRAVSHED